ncbi:tryptophan--tRNA ligase [Kordiimonas sediminis]|uniref:Tryptophan--tRNA ligase n=1 Tax=Kordiimonas sediminis TaxID=1735581 RepID=A0A919ALQ6_9PROT|nr:tryptophan--tRNA ligase [Kordiimonas sediminis]GHF15855.1 tryptophan--tRNA ligase [Kordiimonas sediminis]
MNRVFSGAQPSGNMHLGNYLGAFRNWVGLQDDYECIYCVVDMHAITVWQDPAELVAQTREAAAAYIASGVDPEKSILFNQSQVAGHAELAWVFNCVARIGWLNRMTQFKDKAGKNREKASAGLYVYPNLMAADILLYLATHVPVGEDQKQHLELTRDVAQKFNHDYDTELFPIVEPIIMGEGARIMSLRDGTKKMSKSDPSEYSRINLNDDADTLAQKIRKAKTDPELLPAKADELEGRPEAQNLIGIYAALSARSRDEICLEYEGKGFGDVKKGLTEVVVDKLAPITEEMARLQKDNAYIDSILRDGAERARAIAEPVMADVRKAVGFLS